MGYFALLTNEKSAVPISVDSFKFMNSFFPHKLDSEKLIVLHIQ